MAGGQMNDVKNWCLFFQSFSDSWEEDSVIGHRKNVERAKGPVVDVVF